MDCFCSVASPDDPIDEATSEAALPQLWHGCSVLQVPAEEAGEMATMRAATPQGATAPMTTPISALLASPISLLALGGKHGKAMS